MLKQKINSLDKLKKIKLKKEKPEPFVPLKSPSQTDAKKTKREQLVAQAMKPKSEMNEEEVFLNAMRGVKPMNNASGRQVDTRPAPPPAVLQKDPNKAGQDHLNALVKGLIEFKLEYCEEYMSGFVRGSDPKVLNKLKNGEYSREAHLDLHGLNSQQALDSLLFFIRESYLQGKRCVLLITGRGTGSPGGQSVLKRAVQGWLTREPLRRVVLAFVTAKPQDGGAGALYVLLRKKQKTVGKVRWNRVSEFD